jgi:FixJ family two-component response regulator
LITFAELREHHASLSLREPQVMALVVSGLLNKRDLGTSEITVEAQSRTNDARDEGGSY